MEPTRVLIAEDEELISTSLVKHLKRRGYVVDLARDGLEAISRLQASTEPDSEPYDLLLSDIRMPQADGIEVLEFIARNEMDVATVLMTGFSHVSTAVRAIRYGCLDYIAKPFALTELDHRLEDALKRHRESRAALDADAAEGVAPYDINPRHTRAPRTVEPDILGEHPRLQNVLQTADRFAESEGAVLITGESGTGKELLARRVHLRSRRAAGPWVVVNCGAIPESLLESQLFGHVRGAFTGADRDHKGHFQRAHGGTIFLDEIGEMPLSLQAKLLRVLQSGAFTPVGGSKELHADFRVISATNKELETEVAEGRFREDLYYRLAVLPIQSPPLRERRDDVPVLIEHFASRFSRSGPLHFSDDALRSLKAYPFPGNVRELENIVLRVAALSSGGEVTSADLPAALGPGRHRNANETPPVEVPDEGIDFNSVVNEFENRLILRSLEKTGWNKNQAAKLLGINRTTLVEKIKKKNLEEFRHQSEAQKGELDSRL